MFARRLRYREPRLSTLAFDPVEQTRNGEAEIADVEERAEPQGQHDQDADDDGKIHFAHENVLQR